jgi:hypothetical protein
MAPLLFAVCSMAHDGRDTGLSPAPRYSPEEKARLARKAARTWEEEKLQLMSPMGAIAAGLVPRPEMPAPAPGAAGKPGLARPPFGAGAIGSADLIVHDQPANATQGEASLAANSTGTVLIAGFNEARGFGLSVAGGLSLSGVARSIDGGQTWSVPFQFRGLPVLPAPPNGQVFGDPEVKYDPTRNMWVYASLYLRPSDGRQGLCIHTSVDDGATWQGPIEVASAFVAGASADKEFMDINPRTGRILITWTNFGATAEISSTFTDDVGATWSPRQIIATGSVQSSFPRFMPGPTNATSRAYVTWRRAGATRNIGFASSANGGATWSAPSLITTDYAAEDQILGLDRVNTSPSMAVDHTSGTIYVVYQANNTTGEGDIAFQRSVDQGATFSPRVLINSNPGADRAQWYPTVAVDQITRRVHVVWYDQHASATGDVTELVRTVSSDSGATWSRPVTLLDRPFHAGFGNDLGQPNLGDYNQNVAHNGVHHVVAAATSAAPRFDEGQPSSGSLHTPDIYYDRIADSVSVASLRLATFSLGEICTGGANSFLDPGELADVTIGLRNYVLNPLASPVT